jgi:hypothetical protein
MPRLASSNTIQNFKYLPRLRDMRHSCFPSLAVACVSASARTQRASNLIVAVYFFVGSVIVGKSWYQFVPGGLVMFIGIAYVVLEYIPSIEPPANMR